MLKQITDRPGIVIWLIISMVCGWILWLWENPFKSQTYILPLHIAQQRGGTWDLELRPCPWGASITPLNPLLGVPWWCPSQHTCTITYNINLTNGIEFVIGFSSLPKLSFHWFLTQSIRRWRGSRVISFIRGFRERSQ